MAEQQPTADSPAEFRIFVKTLSGQNLAVQVSLDDTVQDLQVKLSAQDSSLGPETARVIYNQQCMNRDLTLRYYEIKPDCTVFCLRRCKYRVAGGRCERICLEAGEVQQVQIECPPRRGPGHGCGQEGRGKAAAAVCAPGSCRSTLALQAGRKARVQGGTWQGGEEALCFWKLSKKSGLCRADGRDSGVRPGSVSSAPQCAALLGQAAGWDSWCPAARCEWAQTHRNSFHSKGIKIWEKTGRGRDTPLDTARLLSSALLCVAVAVRGGGSPAVESQLPGKAMPWYKDHGPIHLQGMDIKPRHFGEQTPAMIHVGKCRSCSRCRSHTRGPMWLMG